MQFTIKQSDLSGELARVLGAVERKTTLPILGNVLLSAEGATLHLTATDLEISLRSECPATVAKPGAVTLPAKRFADYIRLLPDGDVSIEAHDNSWVSVHRGQSRARIAGLSRDSFPELPAMPDPLCEIPAALFVEVVQRTVFAISTEESRFTLNGARMEVGAATVGKAELRMIATDGHRLAVASMSLEQGQSVQAAALIPRKALSEILKLCAAAGDGDSLRYAEDGNHQFYEIGGRVLTARKLTGKFPDYERVLPKDQPHRVVLDRLGILAALKRVAQFSDERSGAVTLTIAHPGKGQGREAGVTLRASVSDVGESEETLPVEYDGPEVQIGFHAAYLTEFLGVVGANQVRFLFKDGQTAGELRPGSGEGEGKDGDRYRYVVMPMRV